MAVHAFSNQEPISEYEDENGNMFPAFKVDHQTQYHYIADGFFEWVCGGCGKTHADRAFKIQDTVWYCSKCKAANLLAFLRENLT